jgi:hypothetical protein
MHAEVARTGTIADDRNHMYLTHTSGNTWMIR